MKPQPARATVTMKGKAFVPRVVVVPVGGTVDFPNQDPIFHNVFSVSGENRFDLDLYKRPKSGVVDLPAPGRRARLLQHPPADERGTCWCATTRSWPRPAADGSFAIAGVPAGSYVLKAWHERARRGEQAVDGARGRARVEASLTLDASTCKRAPHKNKFGKDYEADEKY